MIRYVARRLGVSALMLVLASVVIFVVLRVIPGDPTAARAGRPGVTAEQLERQREALGLNDPVWQQYLDWAAGVVRLDFGQTYFSDYSTTDLIGPRVLPSVELALAAILLALAIAVPCALVAAARPDSILDRLLTGFVTAGMAFPPFWLGILLIALFSIQLGWFPTRGYVSPFDDLGENLRLLALPATTMAIVVAAPILRFLRSSLLETRHAEFVRTARGKGLAESDVLLRHVLPNALLPTLTFVGLIVGSMLGGVVVVEYVFGWEGLGALAVDSVVKRDYAVLQAVVLLAAAAFILTSLIVDLLAFALDPRLRAQVRA